MDLSQLIEVCRDRINDKVTPYLVSDDDWTRYAIQAQIEAAERSLCLLYDFDITVTASQAEYSLDALIILPVRARLAGGSVTLTKTTQRDIDRLRTSWEAQAGTPLYYYQIEHAVRLYPIPDSDDTLTLRAYAYPQSTLSLPDSLDLEIQEKDHYFLTHWMCGEALAKSDSDLLDGKAAEREFELFEKRFGPARTAHQMRAWRELPPNMRVVPRRF